MPGYSIRGLDEVSHGTVQGGRERCQVRALVSIGDHGDVELVGVGQHPMPIVRLTFRGTTGKAV